MPKRSLAVFLIAAFSILGFAQGPSKAQQPTLTPQISGTTQLLIAVSPVNSQVVWAAGTGGTYVVTTDGGNTWKAAVVPGAENLQFRDVQGVSDKVAYLLSIGNIPSTFRIYRTNDGGGTWQVEFINEIKLAFYDCFAFWSPDRGLAHSDSGNGVFPELRTFDGETWPTIEPNMPPALPGEASFAASGTCITTQGEGNAWIATGGATIARILATTDAGNSWNAYDTPLVSNPAAGGISVAFRDASNGVLGGGDLTNNASAQMARSSDGGQTWSLTAKPPVNGAIFCLAYANGMTLAQDRDGDKRPDQNFDRTVVVTAETQPNYDSGPAAWTPDEGNTWYKLPGANGYWAVGFANPQNGWFVGNNGQILKISF
jgi:photosystem II stability/assembly factor-like uncharacterized protein